jgi:hypothetical protein
MYERYGRMTSQEYKVKWLSVINWLEGLSSPSLWSHTRCKNLFLVAYLHRFILAVRGEFYVRHVSSKILGGELSSCVIALSLETFMNYKLQSPLNNDFSYLSV